MRFVTITFILLLTSCAAQDQNTVAASVRVDKFKACMVGRDYQDAQADLNCAHSSDQP